MGVFSTADLRSILGTQSDKPIAWRNSLGMLLSMSVGAGLGLLLDSATGGQTVLISLLTGMFLGLVSVTGPFVMSLRLVLGVGVLMVLTSGLAVIAVGNAWLAVLSMVFLAFVATVWTAIPMVGGLLGAFPTILFLLIVAKGEAFTGGGSAGNVMLGAAAGVVAALVVLVIMSGWDARGRTRRMAAGAWSPTVSWTRLGSILTVLRLDSAPSALVSVTQSGILAMIGRSWLESDKGTDAYASALRAQEGIVAALGPRGPIVPRLVHPPVAATQEAMKTAGKATKDRKRAYAWDRWESSIGHASRVLAGQTEPPKITFDSVSILTALVRSVLHPESANFRYGVQRAVALGVATFVMIQWDAPDFYWVLLTLFSVMQTNARATLSRSLQYALGTWIGAVGAVVLSLVLPSAVVSLFAMILLVTGFAWMTRNYAVMCVAVAASVVLIAGAPDGDYLTWAGLRALDVTAGVIIALAVSSFLLRVRPQPERHLQQARDALLSTVQQLRGRLLNPAESTAYTLADQGSFLRATANLEADLPLMRDPTAAAKESQELEDANNHLLALASVVFAGEAGTADRDPAASRALLDKGLDTLESRIRAVGSAPLPSG